MFRQLFACALVISAASNVLASPLSAFAQKRSAAVDLTERQFGCPPGLHCGHGPVCTAALCDLPGCADAEVCQDYQDQNRSAAGLTARQFGCPPGSHCGHGPVCTAALCDLPGCADADVCKESQDKKRNAAATLTERQFGCPPGLECGPGPVCTAETCSLPGCADAEVCQESQNQKRSAETDIPHPVCDICIVGPDDQTVCGCSTTPKGNVRREPKICPQYCIITDTGEGLCGCAADGYLESHPNGDPVS